MAKLNGIDDDVYGSPNLPQVVNPVGGSNLFEWEDAWDWGTQDLVNATWEIKRKEASDYLEEIADPVNLDIPDSYADSKDLLTVFLWEDSPQGYDYWEEIYHELVSHGHEEYPEGYDPT